MMGGSVKYIYEKIVKNEFYVMLLIIFICVLYRIITATFISSGGDALYKWFQVKRLLYGFSFDGWQPLYGTWNHHTARWAIIFPTLLFQYVFGTNPLVCYLVVFSFITGATVLLYKIALNIYGLYFAFSTSLLFIFFPVMGKIGSQLLPSVFSCFYVLFSFYLMILLLDKKNNIYVLFSALMLFFAYSAKITNIFFIPAYVYILYRTKRNKNIVLFLGFLFVLFAIENLIFYHFSGGKVFFGKIQCIINGHVGGNNIVNHNNYSILYFLSRWIHLPMSWLILFVISIPISVYIILYKGTKQKIKYVIIFYFCFILFETFAIKSIHPLKIAEPFRVRYVSVVIPFMIMILNYFIVSCIKIYDSKKLFCYIILIFFIPIVYKNSIFIRNNCIVNTYLYYNKINEFFSDNIKIVFEDRKKFYRFLYVFLDDKYIFKKDYLREYMPVLEKYDNKEKYCISKNNSKENGKFLIHSNYEIK